MIALNDFIPLARSSISKFSQFPPNQRQEDCILSPPEIPLMIVAGPGTGKTTVLVLRALRFVFVDGLMPENIVITTFTRKAAAEIRSRLIEWGLAILEHLEDYNLASLPLGFENWRDSIDVNRFITGTLDSICEDTLTTYRDPGDSPPVLVEGFVGNALLTREGMFPSGALRNPDLDAYLANFTMSGQPPDNFGHTIDMCRTIVDRLIQDCVEIDAFSTGSTDTLGRQCVVDSLLSYRDYMSRTNRMDFAGLEETFLDRLVDGRLQRFTNAIKAILVDEYQDTNPLQERIYFELAKQGEPSFTVVGDDDQSLYRFRGATVEMFCNLQDRLNTAVPDIPNAEVMYLIDNYRSTPAIIDFFNTYVTCDSEFANARVQPPKPAITAQIQSNDIPVLGLFRPDVQTLARDLASFIQDIFRGNGYTSPVGGQNIHITRNPQDGDCGDAVLLAHTVNEYARAFRDNPPRERLPRLLRQELETRGIGAFNPRGQAIRDIPEVRILLGLVLDCIDPPDSTNPDGVQQSTYGRLRNETHRYLIEWRQDARDFIRLNPSPNTPRTLREFVSSWQSRINQTSNGATWPEEWPILELCYKLITWIPLFQDDPEGQVYLEAISRCIAQAATFSSYRAMVLHNQGVHDDKSVLHAIRDIMVPLAENSVEVDEEIMPHIPRNCFPLMTIHQAKGLEFPLVIVDIASDYARNHQTQRFRRFPEQPSMTQLLEDDMAPYCEIGDLRMQRNALARAFDDIIRLYYVAYSRAQSLLILTGINTCLRYNTKIMHLATSWRSDETWAWRSDVSGKPPAMVNNHPLELI